MDKINIVSSQAALKMSSFGTETRLKSSSPLVNSLVHTMDLSVVDTMLHDSPYLVIHRTDIWAVWRPPVGRKKVWRFLTQQFNCCTCVVWRWTVLLEQSHYQTLCISLAAV